MEIGYGLLYASIVILKPIVQLLFDVQDGLEQTADTDNGGLSTRRSKGLSDQHKIRLTLVLGFTRLGCIS